jgi:hypothetical protein
MMLITATRVSIFVTSPIKIAAPAPVRQQQKPYGIPIRLIIDVGTFHAAQSLMSEAYLYNSTFCRKIKQKMKLILKRWSSSWNYSLYLSI